MHSPNYLFIHHSIIHSFVHSFIRSCIHFFIHSFIHSFIHEVIVPCFSDATTSDLQNLINDNSFELTLNWVLSIIEEEIRKDSQHPILIDVIPNMKFLSKMGSLMKDCEGEMRLFEEKVLLQSFYEKELQRFNFGYITWRELAN